MARNHQILSLRTGLLLCFLASVLILYGCFEGSAPTKDDITGTWLSADGAELKFNEDGTFTGKSLPAGIFINHTAEYEGKRYDCNGSWSIETKSGSQQSWYIDLNFEKTFLTNTQTILTDSKVIFGKYVFVSGSGLMENKSPWNYLFRWEGEEGGQQYKFEKQ